MVLNCKVSLNFLRKQIELKMFQNSYGIRSLDLLIKQEEIGNKVNIAIIGFTTWKQKIPLTKCYPQWGLNLC